MIKRVATTAALLTALIFGANMVQAEEGKAAAPAPSACEKKADKKKITDAKKREAFIKKCEKKNKK